MVVRTRGLQGYIAQSIEPESFTVHLPGEQQIGGADILVDNRVQVAIGDGQFNGVEFQCRFLGSPMAQRRSPGATVSTIARHGSSRITPLGDADAGGM